MPELETPEQNSQEYIPPSTQTRTFCSWFWFSYFTWYGSIKRGEYFTAWLFLWFLYVVIGALLVYPRVGNSEQAVDTLLIGTGPALQLSFLCNVMLTFLAAKRLQSRYTSPYIAVAILVIKYFFIIGTTTGAAAIATQVPGVKPIDPAGPARGISMLFWIFLVAAKPLREDFILPDDQPRGRGGALILVIITLVFFGWRYIESLGKMREAYGGIDWGTYTLDGTIFYAPLLKPLFAVQALLYLLALCGILYTLYTYMRRRKRFLPVCALCLVSFVGVSIYELMAYCNYTYLLNELTIINVSRVTTAMGACLWIPYIYSARRARLTFIN